MADLSTKRFSEVSFVVKAGDGGYRPVGTDDNASFRVFRVADNYAPGTRLTVKAIVDDLNGHLRSETVRTTAGDWSGFQEVSKVARAASRACSTVLKPVRSESRYGHS